MATDIRDPNQQTQINANNPTEHDYADTGASNQGKPNVDDEFVSPAARATTLKQARELVLLARKIHDRGHRVAGEIGEILLAHKGDAAYVKKIGVVDSTATQHRAVCRAIKRAAYAEGVTGSIKEICRQLSGLPKVLRGLTRDQIAGLGREGWGIAPNKGRKDAAAHVHSAGDVDAAQAADMTATVTLPGAAGGSPVPVPARTRQPAIRESRDVGRAYQAVEHEGARKATLAAVRKQIKAAADASFPLPNTEQLRLFRRGLSLVNSEREELLAEIRRLLPAGGGGHGPATPLENDWSEAEDAELEGNGEPAGLRIPSPVLALALPAEPTADLLPKRPVIDEHGVSLRLVPKVRAILRAWGAKTLPTPTHNTADSHGSQSDGTQAPWRNSISALVRHLAVEGDVYDPCPEQDTKVLHPATLEFLMDLPEGWTDLDRDIRVPQGGADAVTVLLAFAGCGAGGLGVVQGLADVGRPARVVGAIECSDLCTQILQARLGADLPVWTDARAQWTMDRVSGVSGANGVDILALTMPCPPTSDGRHYGGSPEHHPEFYDPTELIQRSRAKWVLFENVRGFATREDGKYLHWFLKILADCGYAAWTHLVDANDFGLLHERTRLIVVARRIDQSDTPQPASKAVGAVPQRSEFDRTERVLSLADFRVCDGAEQRARAAVLGDVLVPVVARAAARCIGVEMLGTRVFHRELLTTTGRDPAVGGSAKVDLEVTASQRPGTSRPTPAGSAHAPRGACSGRLSKKDFPLGKRLRCVETGSFRERRGVMIEVRRVEAGAAGEVTEHLFVHGELFGLVVRTSDFVLLLIADDVGPAGSWRAETSARTSRS